MGVKSNIMGDDFLREMLADDRAYKADKLVERWSKMPDRKSTRLNSSHL